MVEEAEQFKEEDEKTKTRIEAKNGFEAAVFNAKNPPNKDKISEDDIAELNKICEEEIAWLDANSEEEAEVYTKRTTEFQSKVMPIMMKGNEGGMPGAEGMGMPGAEGMNMPGGMPGAEGMGMPGNAPSEPTIEEVD